MKSVMLAFTAALLVGSAQAQLCSNISPFPAIQQPSNNELSNAAVTSIPYWATGNTLFATADVEGSFPDTTPLKNVFYTLRSNVEKIVTVTACSNAADLRMQVDKDLIYTVQGAPTHAMCTGMTTEIQMTILVTVDTIFNFEVAATDAAFEFHIDQVVDCSTTLCFDGNQCYCSQAVCPPASELTCNKALFAQKPAVPTSGSDVQKRREAHQNSEYTVTVVKSSSVPSTGVFDFQFRRNPVQEQATHVPNTWTPVSSMAASLIETLTTAQQSASIISFKLARLFTSHTNYEFRATYTLPDGHMFVSDVEWDVLSLDYFKPAALPNKFAIGTPIPLRARATTEFWIDEYDNERPVFRNRAFKVSGASSYLNLYRFQEASLNSAELHGLESTVTVNSYIADVCQWVRLVFTNRPTTSPLAVALNEQIENITMNTLRPALPTRDVRFQLGTVSNDAQDGENFFTILFAIIDLNTGEYVPNSEVWNLINVGGDAGIYTGLSFGTGFFNFGVEQTFEPGAFQAADSLADLGTQDFCTLHNNANETIAYDASKPANAIVVGNSDDWFVNDPTFWWDLEATTGPAESAAFASATNVFLFNRAANGYLLATATDVMSFVASSASATNWAMGTNIATYFLTSAKSTDSNAGAKSIAISNTAALPSYWAGTRCTTNGNVACSDAPNAPQSRSLHFDLGGVFQVLTIVIDFDHYSVDDLSAQGVGMQVLVREGVTDAWIDMTESDTDGSLTRAACHSTNGQGQCRVKFEISNSIYGTGGATSLQRPATFGIQYVQIKLVQFEVTLSPDLQYFGISDMFVNAYCICNGQSESCDAETGVCILNESGTNIPSRIETCQHFTAGDHCGECKGNYWENPWNDVPRPSTGDTNPTTTCNKPFSNPTTGMFLSTARFMCDGPLLPEATTDSIGNNFYLYDGINGAFIDPNGDWTEIFKVFFPNGGPCLACECHGHDTWSIQGSLTPADTTRGCDVSTGVCVCAASTNTMGDNCENCVAGFCRNLCNPILNPSCLAETCEACSCNGHDDPAQNNGVCNQDGCGCFCNPAHHATGTHCQDCEVGYWSSTGNALNGLVCSECACNSHSATCSPVGGDCMFDGTNAEDVCQDNTQGSSCAICQPNFWRLSSAPLANACSACACNQHGELTTYASYFDTAVAGTISCNQDSVCSPTTGVCTCDANEHTTGDNCESCELGYWNAEGTAEESAGGVKRECLACACNGHATVCHQTGGHCDDYPSVGSLNCQGNTNGPNCETCDAGFFRPCVSGSIAGGDCAVDLTDDCQPCNCNGHITLTNGLEVCNPVGGDCTPLCLAAHGVEGENCESCMTNYWSTPGNGLNGQQCTPCSLRCFTHSSTCNATGWCDASTCQDSTTNGDLGRCDVCLPSFARTPATLANIVAAAAIADTDPARELSCTACNCNGHSQEDPATGEGICDQWTGECKSCGGFTTGFNCEQCQANYFRHLMVDPTVSLDVCSSCALSPNPSGCASQTLADDCSPCAGWCFGGNSQCAETTGECTCNNNESGFRCQTCAPAYSGDPSASISCEPCKGNCYHHTGANLLTGDLNLGVDITVTETRLGGPLFCEQQQPGAPDRSCFYDHVAGERVCNCPDERPADGLKTYLGASCNSCNNQVYFGTPTVCEMPGAGGSALGECNSFSECIPCDCNVNVNFTIATLNCQHSSGMEICDNCLGNTEGDKCQLCASGTYGSAVRRDTGVTLDLGTVVEDGFVLGAGGKSLKCFDCDCNGRSVGNAGTGIVDDTCATTGAGLEGDYTCSCQTGYEGRTCRTCSRGYKAVAGSYSPLGLTNDARYVECEPCPQCVLDVYAVVEPLEETVIQINSTIDAIEASNIALTAEVDALSVKVDTFDARIVAAEAKVSAQESTVMQNSADIDSIQTAQGVQDASISAVQDDIVILTDEADLLEATVLQLQQTITDNEASNMALWTTQTTFNSDTTIFAANLRTDVDANTVLIADNAAAILLAASVGTSNTAAITQESVLRTNEISALSSSVAATYATMVTVSSLDNRVVANSMAVSAGALRLTANEASITALQTSVTSNTNSVASLTSDLASVNTRVDNTNTDLSTNYMTSTAITSTFLSQVDAAATYSTKTETDSLSARLLALEILVIGACAGVPCKNGGTCTQTSVGFTCACASGWAGATCTSSTLVQTGTFSGTGRLRVENTLITRATTASAGSTYSARFKVTSFVSGTIFSARRINDFIKLSFTSGGSSLAFSFDAGSGTGVASVPTTGLLANIWYVVEISWTSSPSLVGTINVYNADRTTLIISSSASVSGSFTTIDLGTVPTLVGSAVNINSDPAFDGFKGALQLVTLPGSDAGGAAVQQVLDMSLVTNKFNVVITN